MIAKSKIILFSFLWSVGFVLLNYYVIIGLHTKNLPSNTIQQLTADTNVQPLATTPDPSTFPCVHNIYRDYKKRPVAINIIPFRGSNCDIPCVYGDGDLYVSYERQRHS